MVRVNRFSSVSTKLAKFNYISSCLFYCLEKRITVKVVYVLLDSVFLLRYNDVLDWLTEIQYERNVTKTNIHIPEDPAWSPP